MGYQDRRDSYLQGKFLGRESVYAAKRSVKGGGFLMEGFALSHEKEIRKPSYPSWLCRRGHLALSQGTISGGQLWVGQETMGPGRSTF